jgi:uncharacterized protein (DUF427 family)
MALHIGRHLVDLFGELQYEPTPKRVRALAGDWTVVDSRRAVLVWEPSRVVPSYAVPAQDVNGTLALAPPDPEAESHPVRLGRDLPPVLDPSTPFAIHTTAGESLTIRNRQASLDGAAFRIRDPDLAEYLVLDFAAFDEWLEEDDRIVGHPRDPFKRIDVRKSSQHVTIARDGQVLADSTSPKLLFETHITPRYYLPREDVRLDLMTPSESRTLCAYKGQAKYWSVDLPGGVVPDLCWTYEQPLSDAIEVRDLVAFFNERVDITVDGVPQERPITPWS